MANPAGNNQSTPIPPGAGDPKARKGRGRTFQVGFQAQAVRRLIHNQRGRFNTMQRTIIAAHDQMSYEVALDAQAIFNKKMKAHRAKVGWDRPHTGNLANALVDERNAKANLLGFAFGLDEFLNSPASQVAPYWRNLEQGTRLFIGRPLIIVGRGGANDFRDISKLEKTEPDKVRYLLESGRAVRVRGKGLDGKTKGVKVKRPIPAYRFLTGAGRNWENNPQRQLQIYQEYFRDWLGVDYLATFAAANGRPADASGR